MWTPLFLFGILVYCSIISSHPIIDKNEKEARQIDFGECCPCPGSPNVPTGASRESGVPNSRLDTGDKLSGRSEDVDDCPCRVRSTDSEAQASDAFQDDVRAVQHLMKSAESKQDLKPLLHPEIDLASSVLETIREATDEEYRDALERDAEKNAETALEDNHATTRNVVNIILSPREDIANEKDAVSEASHVQEARCVHPLGSTQSNNVVQARNMVPEPPDLLKEILGLTNLEPGGLFHKEILDVDTSIGASNIQERITSASRNKALEGLKLKSDPSLLNLFPDNINSDLNGQIINNKVPDFKLKSISETLKDNLERAKERIEDIGNTRWPFDLKDSLKLNNVELVPSNDIVQKALNRLKINVPNLRLTNFLLPKNDETGSNGLTILKPPKLSDFFKSTGICDTEERHIETNSNVQVTSGNNNMRTEVLDALPSASEMQSDTIDTSENSAAPPLDDSSNLSHTGGNTCLCNSDKTDTSKQNVHADNCITSFDTKDMSQINILEHNEDIIDEDGDNTPSVEGKVNSIESVTDDVDDEDTIFNNRRRLFRLDLSNEKGDGDLSIVTSSEVDNGVACNQKELYSSLRNTVTSNEDVLNEESNTSDVLKLIENHNKKEYKYISTSLNDNDTVDEACNTNSSTYNANNGILERINNSDQLSIDNLQRLSDSILNASDEKSHKPVLSDNNIKCLTGEDGSKFKEFEINIDTKENMSKMRNEDDQSDNISTSQETQVDDAERSSETSLEETLTKSDKINTLVSKEHDNGDLREKGCSSDLFSVVTLQQNQVNNNEESKEMIAEPSNSDINTVSTSVGNPLESPLRQNLILEPSPFVLNSVPKIDNLLNLNTQLPTLDDIRRRLSGIIDESERNENVEFVNDNNSNDPIMSTDASTTNFRSALPSLTPTENINLDIFQIKPLTAKPYDPLVSKFPLLNLNSYKAKLPVPDTLDLQPLKLESTFGNKVGMLGASLTLGPDKTGIPKDGQSRRKSSSISNFNDPRLLRNSLTTKQNFDDLKASLRVNAENLLNLPAGLRKNLLGNNLRTNLPMRSVSNNRKSLTENIVKNIQNTQESVLKEKKPNSDDLVGMVSRTHAEVDSKLQELRSNLSNHLTSIRKSITDKQSPLSTIGGNKIETSYNGLLQSPFLIHGPERQSQNFHIKNPSLSRDVKFRTPQLVAIGGKDKIGKNKITAAGSASVSKTMTIPLLQRSSLKQNIESITKRPTINKNSISNVRMTSQSNREAQDITKSELRKPIRDNKKNVSFSTTDSRSNPAFPLYKTKPSFTIPSKSKFRTASPLKNEEFSEFLRKINTYRPFDQATVKTKLLKEDDTRGALSEFLPFSIQVPVSPAVRSKSATGMLKDNAPNSAIESATSELNISPKYARNPKKLARTQFPENAFLSKVRDAVKANLSNINRGQEYVNRRNGDIRTTSGSDMTQSPSENLETVNLRNEPMKEYVSYKCRMVCTKG